MTFRAIIGASVFTGAAGVLGFVTSVVRAKVVAVDLGEAGLGLMGIFAAHIANLSALACWGIWTAGPRTIAGAADQDRLRKSAAVGRLGRRLTWLGLGLALAAVWPAGLLAFGDQRHAWDLAVCGLAVPLTVAAGVWTARLQAYGHVRAMAFTQAVGALSGLFIGVPLIWWYGIRGVAPSLLVAASTVLLCTRWQARKLCPEASDSEADPADIKALAALGLAFMLAAFLGQLAAYGARLVVLRGLSLEAAGQFHAAAAIGGSLPSLVVSAMGAGFFPLVAASDDEHETRLLVSRQIRAGLVLGLAPVCLLMAVAPSVVELLYSASFLPAVPVLKFMLWGVLFRLASWPIAYWLMAQGSVKEVIAAECASASLAVLLPLALVSEFGLPGAGFAFMAANVLHGALLCVLFFLKSGAWPDRAVFRAFVLAAACLLLAQVSAARLEPSVAVITTAAVASAVSLLEFGRARRE